MEDKTIRKAEWAWVLFRLLHFYSVYYNIHIVFTQG